MEMKTAVDVSVAQMDLFDFLSCITPQGSE